LILTTHVCNAVFDQSRVHARASGNDLVAAGGGRTTESGPNQYVRIERQGFRVVHRANCSKVAQSTRAQEWKWAEGKDYEELVAALRDQGVDDHFCRVCFRRNRR